MKKELEELRQQAEAEGMDAGATYRALWRLAEQLREELPRTRAHRNEVPRQVKANGLDNNESGG